MWAITAFMASFLVLVFNESDKVTRFTVGAAFVVIAALIVWCACDAWTGDEWYIELLTGRFLAEGFRRLVWGKRSECKNNKTILIPAKLGGSSETETV
jgi:hypothetical protein